MVSLLLLVGCALGAMLLLNQVRKRAQLAGKSPASWSLGLLMVWGFLWVGGRELGHYLSMADTPETLLAIPLYWRPLILGLTLLLALLAYVITIRRLKRQASQRDMDDLLQEIGE